MPNLMEPIPCLLISHLVLKLRAKVDLGTSKRCYSEASENISLVDRTLCVVELCHCYHRHRMDMLIYDKRYLKTKVVYGAA